MKITSFSRSTTMEFSGNSEERKTEPMNTTIGSRGCRFDCESVKKYGQTIFTLIELLCLCLWIFLEYDTDCQIVYGYFILLTVRSVILLWFYVHHHRKNIPISTVYVCNAILTLMLLILGLVIFELNSCDAIEWEYVVSIMVFIGIKDFFNLLLDIILSILMLCLGCCCVCKDCCTDCT